MEPTRNPNTDPASFSEKADQFFRDNNTPRFKDVYEATGMVSVADPLIDIYLDKLANEGYTYTEELVLQIGCAVGEALCMVFNGGWKYSQNQERWVVSFQLPSGSDAELNIFYKMEKRFQNGMEDSIQYLFDGFKKMYLDEYNALVESQNGNA